jgi:hypothetical protein
LTPRNNAICFILSCSLPVLSLELSDSYKIN